MTELSSGGLSATLDNVYREHCALVSAQMSSSNCKRQGGQKIVADVAFRFVKNIDHELICVVSGGHNRRGCIRIPQVVHAAHLSRPASKPLVLLWNAKELGYRHCGQPYGVLRNELASPTWTDLRPQDTNLLSDRRPEPIDSLGGKSRRNRLT